jgi:hypothetical protein
MTIPTQGMVLRIALPPAETTTPANPKRRMNPSETAPPIRSAGRGPVFTVSPQIEPHNLVTGLL